jgi:hypothetical protein
MIKELYNKHEPTLDMNDPDNYFPPEKVAKLILIGVAIVGLIVAAVCTVIWF